MSIQPTSIKPLRNKRLDPDSARRSAPPPSGDVTQFGIGIGTGIGNAVRVAMPIPMKHACHKGLIGQAVFDSQILNFL